METTDPSGSYDVGEVLLRVAGVPMTKGDGATGAFVSIGPGAPAFHPPKVGADGSVVLSRNNDRRRPLAIALLKSSESNGILRSLKNDEAINTSIVVEREDGGTVLEAKLVMFADDAPRSVGQRECRWDMTVVAQIGQRDEEP